MRSAPENDTGKYPRMSVYSLPLVTPYYAILPHTTFNISIYFEECRHNLLVLQDSTFTAAVSHDIISLTFMSLLFDNVFFSKNI